MKQLGDKERVWLSHELAEREEIAASAAKAIASSEYPRDVVRRYMPKLMLYEILPNIIWDGESDDDIREFAKSKISPPRRLSKAPDFDHHNKKPLIPVFECIMLSIDVELGTPMRTQTERDEYGSILDLAISYGRAKKKPFADWNVGTFGKYQIEPKRFIKWVKLMGKHPPEEWDPTVDEEPIVKGGPRYEEAVSAGIVMCDDPNEPPPTTLDKLYQFMIDHKEKYPENCGTFPSLNIETIKRQVRREAERYDLDNKDPLKDSRFKKAAAKN